MGGIIHGLNELVRRNGIQPPDETHTKRTHLCSLKSLNTFLKQYFRLVYGVPFGGSLQCRRQLEHTLLTSLNIWRGYWKNNTHMSRMSQNQSFTLNEEIWLGPNSAIRRSTIARWAFSAELIDPSAAIGISAVDRKIRSKMRFTTKSRTLELQET